MGCPPECADCDTADLTNCPSWDSNIIEGEWIVRFSTATDDMDTLFQEYVQSLTDVGNPVFTLDSFLIIYPTANYQTNSKFQHWTSLNPSLIEDLNDHFLPMKDTVPPLEPLDVKVLKTCGCRMALIWVNPAKIDLNDSSADASSKTREEDTGDPGTISSVDVNRRVTFGPAFDTVSTVSEYKNPDELPFIPILKPDTSELVATDYLDVAVIDSGLDHLHSEINKRKFSENSVVRSVAWTNRGETRPKLQWPNASLSPVDWNSWMKDQPDNNCYYNDFIGYDFVHDSIVPIDRHGHGTHVGGVIATATDVDSMIRVMPLKVAGFVEENGEEVFTADLFSVVCAMEYAIEKKVSVINMSLGYYAPYPNEQLEQLTQNALDSNILIVTSAGNDKLLVDCCPHWPSSLSTTNEHVVSVASLDTLTAAQPILLASFSNFGNDVDIAAPGYAIKSAKAGDWGSLITKNGTSMAAAVISRQAALLRRQYPQNTAAQTKKLLTTTMIGNLESICVKDGTYFDYDTYSSSTTDTLLIQRIQY